MYTLPAPYRERAPLPPRRRSRHGLRRLVAVVLAIAVVMVAVVGVSLVGALRTPGNESFQAKWADWLRAHHAGLVAKAVEQYYYDHHAPPKGGQPAGLNSVPAPVAPARVPAPPGRVPARVPAVRVGLPRPSPVSLVVAPGLPGEGRWTPAGAVVRGVDAMYVAQFRADTVYTSQITSAVWIDPTLLRVALVPGAREPAGTWAQPPDITGTALSAVVAAFNGGFRFSDAHGGFYLDGRQAVPLQAGAASMVIYSNGRINIGVWGRDVTMSPQVTAVLQNLVPIVEDGQTAPNATYSDTRLWGATLGASTVVARSGIGVTATGALVYVAGPALTARSLAESLQRAGAIRAMALDINPEWVTFNFYTHPDPANPAHINAAKLYPQMQRAADRYLGPSPESRDFFTVSLPPSTQGPR
jgi:Phosphodiester glycosidase